MAKPELGAKHQCQACGARFFDLNRSPIVCPKCGTIFQGATAASPRVAARAMAADDDEETEASGAEVVSLEDADAEAEKSSPGVDEDVEIEVNDDAFLEEEEEDGDDVGDLIDGDREEDEEP